MKDNRRQADGRESRAPGTGGKGRDPGTKQADGGTPVTDGGLDVSGFMEVLASERRRYALYYLRENENAEFEEVTEQVAARETETPPGELDERTKRTVRVDLYHVQLPKLEASGMIEYDGRLGPVTFHRPPGALEQILDHLVSIESPETG